MSRLEVLDTMKKVGSTINGDFLTDDKLLNGFNVWCAMGRPARTMICVENGPKDTELYRRVAL